MDHSCHECGEPQSIWMVARCTNPNKAVNCGESFCFKCLSQTYPHLYNSIFKGLWWLCPACMGICKCETCTDPVSNILLFSFSVYCFFVSCFFTLASLFSRIYASICLFILPLNVYHLNLGEKGRVSTLIQTQTQAKTKAGTNRRHQTLETT
jgi:hypothetical protein